MDYNALIREHNELVSQPTLTGEKASRIWEIRLKIQKECGVSCWEDGYKNCDLNSPIPVIKQQTTINQKIGNASIEARDILKNCTIKDNIVRLPVRQLERKLYQEIAKSLELIGGKWKGNKVMRFVFTSDPTELLEQIVNGEKRNLKKEFQFFATPDLLAESLVAIAGIESEHTILEPSAGQGAIVDVIIQLHPQNQIFICEMMPTNQIILNQKYDKVKNVYFLHPANDDFFNLESSGFDRIIANPPFANNQDIDHIKEMYHTLNKNGRIVTIASKHWQLSNNRKETEFREWLKDVGAKIHEIKAGTFKKSGTMISSVVIVIDKI